MELGRWRYFGHCCRIDNADRLLNSPLHLHVVHAVLCPVRVDPVRGRSVCAGPDPIAWTWPTGQSVLREHDDFPVLGPLIRNPAGTDDRAADYESYAVQRIVSAGVRRLQPDGRDERGQRL